MGKINEEFTMEELLGASQRELRVRDVVKGEVVSVTEKCAKIDLGTFTEGTIYLDHFTTDKNVLNLKDLVKVGDVVEAEVTKVSNLGENSEILLSRLNTCKKEAYEAYKVAHPVESNVDAKVIKVLNERGYILSDGHIEMFLSVKDLKDVVLNNGDKVTVKIISFNDEKQNAFVSRYAVVREERQREFEERQRQREELEAKKAAEIASYNVGDVLKGTVANIVPYGVFVKLNLAQGLIRLKDVDHTFIKSAAEILSVGDEVEVKVVSNENGKLELSRKALLKSPYELYKEANEVASTVTGKVVNKMPFGLLLELAPHVSGLLHISEISWNPNDNYMASVVIGNTVEVSIINYEPKKEKVSLSRKPLLDNPWARVDAQVDDVVEVKITEVLERAFKVACLGVDGLLPFSLVDGGEKKAKATDVYQVGDTVKCIIHELDSKRWILTLNEKAYKAQEERAHYEKYLNEQESDPVTIGDLFKDQF